MLESWTRLVPSPVPPLYFFFRYRLTDCAVLNLIIESEGCEAWTVGSERG